MSINLMPWREARRKQLQKDFVSKIGLSTLVAVGVVVIGALAVSSLISGEKGRIQYLQTNIDSANKDIEEIKTLEKKREQMLGRKKVIEKLQADRDQLPHIMYELATNAVDGVTINTVGYKNKLLTIEGKSTSNSAVASFINNLEQSPWFDKPEIIIIQNQDDAQKSLKTASAGNALANRYTYIYVIRSGVKNPNAPQDEEQVEQAPTKKDNRHNRAK